MPRPETGPAFAGLGSLIKIPSGPRPLPPLPGSAAVAPLPAAVPPGLPGWARPVRWKIAQQDFRLALQEEAPQEQASRKARSEFRYHRCVFQRRERQRSRLPFLWAARGADIGLTGNAGFGGVCEDDAMLITLGLLFRRRIHRARLRPWGGDVRRRLGSHRRELLGGKLQLRARRLRIREPHDIGKRRQYLRRFLRRVSLYQRLARMCRTQRLGEYGLTRMKRICADDGAGVFSAMRAGADFGARPAGRIAGKSLIGP